MNMLTDRRVRRGKTARDRANGAHATNRANKEQRAEYVRWCKATSSVTAKPNFPLHTCNGKRSRALRAKPAPRTFKDGGASRKYRRIV